jgi:hypothetical protein
MHDHIGVVHYSEPKYHIYICDGLLIVLDFVVLEGRPCNLLTNLPCLHHPAKPAASAWKCHCQQNGKGVCGLVWDIASVKLTTTVAVTQQK